MNDLFIWMGTQTEGIEEIRRKIDTLFIDGDAYDEFYQKWSSLLKKIFDALLALTLISFLILFLMRGVIFAYVGGYEILLILLMFIILETLLTIVWRIKISFDMTKGFSDFRRSKRYFKVLESIKHYV